MPATPLGPALKAGALAVLLTDTIYGIVTSAWQEESIARVYTLKKRTPSKPCIILIKDADEMRAFGVDEADIARIAEYHTDTPTSFIVPIQRTDLTYLDRGTGTLAFRIPREPRLHELLQESGPLIAPSANTEGNPPATTIAEARAYFGDAVTHYVDGGTRIGNPSAVVDLTTGTIQRPHIPQQN